VKAVKILGASIQILLVLPMWFYFLYSILRAINADRLLWFLFWAYLPLGVLCRVIEEIASRSEKP
jgi:quinol-cytochrome oxidoreductase complex cytochrome b subunit